MCAINLKGILSPSEIPVNKLHSVSKYVEALPLGDLGISCPTGMIRGMDMAFGMGHEAKNPPGGITYTGYTLQRTVRIPGISRHVTVRIYILEDNLVISPQ